MEAKSLLLVIGLLGVCLGAESFDGCECVPYFQCDENRVIKDAGQGLIDVRIPTCENAVDVCCLPPDGSNVGPPRPPIEPPVEPPRPPIKPPAPYEPPQEPGDYPEVPRPQRPLGSGCGLKRITEYVNFGDSYRITGQGGGPEPTGFGEYPWMVAIFKQTDSSNLFVCGGSLIHPLVVLTGAHCVKSTDVSKLKVRAGEWDTVSRKEPILHQDRGAARIISHPDFNPDTLHNDVALIVLDSPFELTDSVDTICFPAPDDFNIDSSNCVATGWGKNDFGPEGEFQTILRKVTLPIVERNECQERLRKSRLGKYFRLHQSFICAGGIPQQDTCTGDGGGPLVCPISGAARYTQVGVVAWGIGCGNENPAVYASVQHFSTWINDHLNQLFNPCLENCQDGPPPPSANLPAPSEETSVEEEQAPTPQQPVGSGCGLRRIIPAVGFRITGQGGLPETTGFGEFPWMVAIFRMNEGVRTFVCGGSLIHPSVILTAAHCVNNTDGINVRSGDWDLQKKTEPLPYQDRGVSRIVVHPEFKRKGLLNDIALIFTETPFELTVSVDTVCIPDSDLDTSKCIATGWGKNDFGGKFQGQLKGVGVPIIERNECQERLRKSKVGKYFNLHQSVICAGGIPEQDTCTGDGGGPLVCPTTDSSRYAQIGVVSWGLGCGNDLPAAYVSVQHFSQWIKDQISQG